MLGTIAFCVDEIGRVVSFEAASWVRLYQRCLDTWVAVGDLPPSAASHFLAGCMAVVGESVCGPLRAELERRGVGVWELPGQPEDLVELVWNEERRMA